MLREEPRTGRIADFEFQFWECWELDDNVPQVLKRHWFRSDTGLEALTYDHMLQMLYRQKMGLPVGPAITSLPQPSSTSEWDKRVTRTVLVRGEEVLITICEHYTEASGGAPVSTKVIGPHGLITSSYPEMLERLGIAPENEQSAIGSRHSAKTKERQSALSPPQADISAKPSTPRRRAHFASGGLASTETDSEKLALSKNRKSDGNSVPPCVAEGSIPVVDGDLEALEASEEKPQPAMVGMDKKDQRYKTDQPASAGSPQTQEPESAIGQCHTEELSAKTDVKGAVPISSHEDKSEAEHFRALDARDMQEAEARGDEFEKRHPWLWEDPDEELEEPLNSMRLVWWGEYIKAVYPELAAAALDAAKYQAYINNYDYERPIPLNAPGSENEQPVGANAPRCQYTKADGEQCGCPALKRKRFCYFHSKTADGRKRKKSTSTGRHAERSSDLELPVLENDRAIQMAVTNICRQLATDGIEPKRASTLLYGLQVAAVAVRRSEKNRFGTTF